MATPRRSVSSIPSWLAASVLLACTLGGTAVEAQGNRTQRAVFGVVRDSASRQPLAGALVDLRAATFRATDRADEDGNFRIRGVAPGRYTLTVVRIGFREVRREIEVRDANLEVAIAMAPIAQTLDAFRVRGDITAIYGVVAALPDLRPIAGTRVQVIGANVAATTDSAGGFFVPLTTPGQYVVRMTHDGYAERTFTIAVPRDRAVEASRVLDPGEASPPGFEGLFKDFDARIRQRAAVNAALVGGAELRKSGSTLIDALKASPSFAEKGLRIADSACVFVNGVPRPGVSLEAFRADDIEAVEAYGLTTGTKPVTGVATGDRTGSLALAWPGKAACGVMFDRSTTQRRMSIKTGDVFYVVVWLRK